MMTGEMTDAEVRE
jgi:hypothetical protein